MEKALDNETIFMQIETAFKDYSLDSLFDKSLALESELLSINGPDEGVEFHQRNRIYPGNNYFFSTFSIIFNDDYGKKAVDNYLMEKVGKNIDLQLGNLIMRNSSTGANALMSTEGESQKKYIFKMYLLYLLLSESELNSSLCKITDLTVEELTAISFFIIVFFQKEFITCYGLNSDFSKKFLANFKNFLVKHVDFIVMDINEFKRKQIEKYKANNFDLFSTRWLLKDYPIIKNGSDYHVVSYLFIQNAIVSRAVYSIANKGVNSDIIGKAYEKIIYDTIVKSYSCQSSCNKTKKIYFNPGTKKKELCDIMIACDDKYILIDCKAKGVVESIYSDNADEVNFLAEKYKQRLDRIKDIKENRFDKFFPKDVNVDNIFSLIALMDDSWYPRIVLINNDIKNITSKERDYCLNNIDSITYENLLEAIIADVDLISIFKKRKCKQKLSHSFSSLISVDEKKEYNMIYNKWYGDTKERLLEMIDKYDLYPEEYKGTK